MTDLARPPSRQFAGFPDRMELVPVPGAVFGTLLREIDNLAELKTLLHVLRLLHGQPRTPRFVQRASLLADGGLLEALGSQDGRTDEETVASALDRAVGRGTLIAIRVTDGATEDECYLLNTRANERIARQVLAGERTLGELGPAPVPRESPGTQNRPTIYELYEQNIGLLTPLLGEELREAAESYPAAWIEDAFREAVAQNRRSWRYARRILETWASRGRGTSGTTWRRPDPPEDPRAYLESRHGRLVRR
jgi:DnaD/phage-associated family protein